MEKRVNGILYYSENWPDRSREYYQKEVEASVKSELDSEFERRVREGAEARARKRLGELVNAVWPVWLSENIEPRVVEFERKANGNAFQLLKRPWTSTCDRCGTNFDDELTPFEIEELLTKGRIQLVRIAPCSPPEGTAFRFPCTI